jgi:DNA-binding MarR family transcriptional regulator
MVSFILLSDGTVYIFKSLREVFLMNNEIYEKFTRLQWLLHKQQMSGYHDGGHLADTTRGQGRILAALRMKDGISTKDLSYLLGLAVSSLNEFLSKLEKGGYITREQSEQDKRVMLVKLTEKGKAQQEDPETADFGDVFDCLSNEEQVTFGAYLDKVIVVLQAKFGFGEDGFERLREIQAERMRMFAAMGGVNGRSFDTRDFRGRFGGFGRGHSHDDDDGRK